MRSKELTGISSKKIVFFVTEDWYFCSHRLPIAVAAKNAGYTVYVVTRETMHGDEIRSAGIRLVPINLSRRSKNPFVEFNIIRRLAMIYKEIKPDIVHNVAIKPVVYGSIAARIAKVPAVVSALAGLGFLFSSDSALAQFLRPLIRLSFRVLLNDDHSTVILQNPDDIEVMVQSGTIDRDRIKLIMGSGVDTDQYKHCTEPKAVPIVVLAARLLWDKGVGEFVEAARQLRKEGTNARFVLVGESDDENPESIGTDQIDAWLEEDIVEWWGRRSDMPVVLAESHIVCLPSYREGLPKVLVEAASCGRPIVTTNAPGCREIVKDGLNGFLVPVKNVDALAEAIHALLKSPEMRIQMGRAGRQRVIDRFSVEKVIEETLEIYDRAPQ